MTEAVRTTRARTVTVVLVAATTIAVAGYLTGTARDPERGGYHRGTVTVRAEGLAPRQVDMARARYADRNEHLVAAVAALGEVPRDAEGAIVLTAEERGRMDAEGAALRAYVGAPPRIPHAVDTRGLPACLVCHERGMRVNGRVAPAMRHEERASCLQCHAPPSGLPRPANGAAR